MNLNYDLVCKYSISITGKKNLDLVHHCISVCDLSNVEKKETYFFRVMSNEWKDPRSKFNKLYGRNQKTISISDVPVNEIELTGLDRDKAATAISIISERFPLESKIFHEAIASTMIDVSKKTGVNRVTIEKICKFVRKQIIDEYHRINNL